MGNPSYTGGYSVPRQDLGAAFMEWMRGPMTYIALKVLPFFLTPRQSAKFSKLRRESMLKPVDVKRASDGTYNEVSISAEDDSYSCEERGIEVPIDDRERSLYQSDFDLDMASLEQAKEKILLRQEIDVAALIFNTTTWTGADYYTDNSGSPWATASTDVVAQILAAKEKVRRLTGVDPDTLVVGETRFQDLLKNDDIILRFPGASIVTEEMLIASMASIFGLKKIFRGKGVKNTANQGLDASISDIWSTSYAMVCKTADPGDGILAPCVGRTFLWTPESAEELVVETYRWEKARGNRLRARHDAHNKVVDKAFGHLMKIA